MRKLTLSLESLQVTSFEPHPAARGARGTVRAHGDTEVECPSLAPNPCLATTPDAECADFTGPCTGPQCDYTLALSCAGCESLDLAVCP